MIKIGITGQAGFIGTHLYNILGLQKDKYRVIEFADDFFQNPASMDSFIRQCDVIVHLAAVNRHADPQELFNINMGLVKILIQAMDNAGVRPYVIMASSLQEERDNLYGRSKKEGRLLFNSWADNNDAMFTGLIIPNVFGPFGVPFYNSVISTFSYQLTHSQEPRIEIDAELKLIYINDLVNQIDDLIIENAENISKSNPLNMTKPPRVMYVEPQARKKVSDLLVIMKKFHEQYVINGIIPDLSDRFELSLFNTFRSYLPEEHYPVKYTRHSDERGDFVEVMKFHSGGQASYSSTKPGITRGNHFHIRKMERFSVIRGKASIKLRKYGTDQVSEYIIDRQEPAYIDIPIWYTHNITNLGEEDLVTLFWINEFYDPSDPDTYFEKI